MIVTQEEASYIEKFNEAVTHFSHFCFCTIDSGLQKEASAQIYDFLQQLAEDKAAAVATGDERWANFLLGCECRLKGMRAEILMWVLLKEEKPDEAWRLLVDAQGFTSDAMKSDDGFQLQPFIDHLAKIERVVFPPQAFMSAGMVCDHEECSICHGDYENCDHIKGRPYMGEFCTVELFGCEPDHVALVDEPASKHCRVHTVSTPEGRRSKMTRLVEPYKVGEGPPEDGSLLASATILHLGPEKA